MPLFNPESSAEIFCAGIPNSLNNRSEMNVPSEPESVRDLEVYCNHCYSQ